MPITYTHRGYMSTLFLIFLTKITSHDFSHRDVMTGYVILVTYYTSLFSIIYFVVSKTVSFADRGFQLSSFTALQLLI